jgi:hypothetical protein
VQAGLPGGLGRGEFVDCAPPGQRSVEGAAEALSRDADAILPDVA